MRLMLLYQRIFQNQRLELTARDNNVEVAHLFDHGRDLWQMLAVEIAADTVFQLLRLPDVYDLPVLVEHDIHTRQQRQIIRFFTQSIEHRKISPPYKLHRYVYRRALRSLPRFSARP